MGILITGLILASLGSFLLGKLLVKLHYSGFAPVPIFFCFGFALGLGYGFNPTVQSALASFWGIPHYGWAETFTLVLIFVIAVLFWAIVAVLSESLPKPAHENQ